MSELTQDQIDAIEIAHFLADQGAPIFSASRNSGPGMEFFLPSSWQAVRPLLKDRIEASHRQIERWRPGMALAMVCGVVYDVIDVDPRNGGDVDWAELDEQAACPDAFGHQKTPSGGDHYYIARTHLAKAKYGDGIDLQAGDDKGEGRGFAYLAPTERVSKWGPNKGKLVAYRWHARPEPIINVAAAEGDVLHLAFKAHVTADKPARRAVTPRTATAAGPGLNGDADPFYDTPDSTWTPDEANRVIDGQVSAVRAAREGAINNALGGAARVLGRFVAGGYLAESEAVELLTGALREGGVHSDSWNIANGRGWTAATVIGAALARGAEEPWEVVSSPAPGAPPVTAVAAPATVPSSPAGAGSGAAAPAAPPGPSSAYPRLLIAGAADMAYWLQSTLGTDTLSGFFLRNGVMVHTARVGELGYVPARDGKDDENGPAQIVTVSAGQLAAKVQYSHACYKMADVKDEDGKKTGERREVPALFPLPAAQRAVDAPEAMGGLRVLQGITHTPMARRDGTILSSPGYDKDSGYLFLPGQGVNVKGVPDVPAREDVLTAATWLDDMTAGFPWESDDDRANYYGLLLTPLLRLLAPPTYKMFGIGAHQPGSGKTLLADIARIIHGGVLRTEMPAEEKEVKGMITALLTATAAPVVHVDNITGVLRSSALAGLLTSEGDVQEREYGQNTRMVTYTNDRTWVFTGNNLSLGGDLVRRAVIITIDPNMASPETRSFAIPDLKAWVREHRNELLWSLLVLIRHWVAQGSIPQARAQSDSFARWEATVGGILAAAGIEGAFDAESGKRAAAGGDDDGTAGVLEHVFSTQGSKTWQAADVMNGTSGVDFGDFVGGSMEWLPSSVLDKLARSEAAGRKSFGYWLRNRVGRWVSGSDNCHYVIREVGKNRMGAIWRVERKGEPS